MWLEILRTINNENDLNEDDIIKKIKEKLEVIDPSIYERWKKTNFDVNYIVDPRRYTLLHLAASIGCTKVVKALIESRADVNVIGEYKRTPLHFASWSGHKEVVEILIKNGANVNLVDHKFEKNPLHLAAENGYTEIARILIENGANVNAMDRKKITPLYFAAKGGHKEVVHTLMKNGADPLLKNKNKILRYLTKSDNLEQHQKEQNDDRYELLKCSLLCRDSRSLVDVVEEDTFDDLICTWSGEISGLTPSQNELNNELLSILQACPSVSDEGDYDESGYIARLEKFLEKNQNNQDLKVILNLRRGESKLTILHAISSIAWVEKEYDDSVALFLKAGADPNIKDDRGRIPLHYATGLNSIDFLIKAGANPNACDNKQKTPLHYIADTRYSWCVDLLLENGADPSMCDKQGKTPLDIAIDNRNYFVEEHLLTNEQKTLQQELYNVLDNINPPSLSEGLIKLKEFLNKHRNTQNLSRVLNLHEDKGESQIFQIIRDAFRSNKTACQEAKKLLLAAGVKDFKELGGEKTLWNNLIPNQQVMLKTFLDEVDKAQDMDQLIGIVNEAIGCGVRFNFPHQGRLYGKMYESKYSFMDYVIKRISELKKNPEVASNIVCSLISKGAVLYNINSMNVLDILESEFEDHKADMIAAYVECTKFTLKFMEVVKSAATGEVKDVKIDNSTLYLEYSKDSTINIAKITDEAKELEFTEGEEGYGRNIIKIGKSEVEIVTKNDIRNYTDLADGSNIVLTFYTILGKIDVRLYIDVQDKSRIIVEVSNKKEILEKFKNCKEEIGEDCKLGGCLAYDAIEQGYFERPEKLKHSSPPAQRGQSYKLKATNQQLQQDLHNIESNIIKREKDFDTKTHLDVFKILHKLLKDEENTSKADLVNVAEKQSKRLGLEGRYNWNEIFDLEKKVSQNVEQKGSNLPLSNDRKVNEHEKQLQKGLCYSNLPRCSMGELRVEKVPNQHKALLVK